MNLTGSAAPWLAGVFAALLILAAIEDVWRLRISNLVSAAIIVAAFVAIALAGPVAQLWQNVAVFAGLLAAGTMAFAAGKLGGGDVKLLAASGLWFDLSGAWRMLVAVAILGGVLAIIILALRMAPWSVGARARVATLRPKGGIPYGVAIAAGALAMLMIGRG